MTDVDYADDLVLLTNKPAKVESSMHSLEQAAIGIGFYVDPNKTEFMCFKRKGAIFTLSW